MASILNFLVFVFFYKGFAAQHVSEYWRSVHAGQMLVAVLPCFLVVSVVLVALTLLLARVRNDSNPRRG